MLNKIDELVNSFLKEDANLSERLLYQLKYAKSVSKMNGNVFDDVVNDAESYLVSYLENNTFCEELVNNVEGILSPLSECAKKYEVICVAHAHIDMNWKWPYDETVAVTVDTFQTMLDVMDEYPDFIFSQSQASVYKIIEKHHPEMLEAIKKKVKEGRWEITASTWVEFDKNIPNGESHSRQYLYTKNYLSKLFNVDINEFDIDVEPDTFGHNCNVPEILSNAGVKYYYHCRGKEMDNILYKWISPSGASVLVYREPNWYNAEITPAIALDILLQAEKTGSDLCLKLYGVGDHGGGPTRKDIEKILEMNTWPIFPKFRFGTMKEYFHTVDCLKDKVPVVYGELNHVFDGCYTTQTRIKKGNRLSENGLYDSELFSAFSKMKVNNIYRGVSFFKAWENVLFNQFHDILPGSCIPDTREHAMALYQETMAVASTNRKIAFKKIIDNIDTKSILAEDVYTSESTGESSGAGFYQTGNNAGSTRIYHLFNSLEFTVSKLTEIIIWDYEKDIDKIIVTDEQGDTVPHQVILKNVGYRGHDYSEIIVKADIPACGYRTYKIEYSPDVELQEVNIVDVRQQFPENFVLENEYIKVEIDSATGCIKSIIDLETGNNLVDSSGRNANFRICNEAQAKSIIGGNAGMSSWIIGRYKKIEYIGDYEMRRIENGPIRQAISMETEFRDSKINIVISLDKYSNKINFDVKCEFKEFGSLNGTIPNLNFYVPLSYDCNNYLYDNAYGVIKRKSANMDYSANSFVMAIPEDNNRKTLMLITDSKYGFRCVDNDMAVTLIRNSFEPDIFPEIGEHSFSFSLNLVDGNIKNIHLINKSKEYNHNILAVAGKSREGNLPLSDSYMEVLTDNIAVSSVKISEDGKNLVVRVYEIEGEHKEARIRLNFDIKNVVFADILEEEIFKSDIRISDNVIEFDILPYTVNTLLIEL